MNRFSYGKLVDGNLEYPPAEFHENGMAIVGFTEEFILQHGYKKIVQTEPPDETNPYEPVYTDNGDSIVQTWTPQI